MKHLPGGPRLCSKNQPQRADGTSGQGIGRSSGWSGGGVDQAIARHGLTGHVLRLVLRTQPPSVQNLSRRIITCVAAIFVAGWFSSVSIRADADPKIRFEAVDIFVDAHDQPLAAYQLEFSVKNGGAKIVGIEGGTHPAFSEPPFYDSKAMQKERVIIAAFSTAKGDQLPREKTRVATIHLQVSGGKEPEFSVKLQTAASIEGTKIPAEASVERKEE